ncbi:AAA domain-containing protein [Mycena chlorophos]|uniref:AAA domain-containing protein n=1 Tax=Mycena chlorophos TaxID=658473 RepID=A0A8H6SBZ2_MYCCL|nr:AAA domain-containing protein [Mycena chlorophos]
MFSATTTGPRPVGCWRTMTAERVYLAEAALAVFIADLNEVCFCALETTSHVGIGKERSGSRARARVSLRTPNADWENDIQILKTYGQGPYAAKLKTIETNIKDVQKRINERLGIKESDTGLSSPNLWDLAADRAREEPPLQVARCTKIIPVDPAAAEVAKAVNPPRRAASAFLLPQWLLVLDPSPFASAVLSAERIRPATSSLASNAATGTSDAAASNTSLGIDPPKAVMLYGLPGTDKTLRARAVANRTDATFIRVIGSELVQKYVGDVARAVAIGELFEMAWSKKACIIFFDEVDAIGGARFDDGADGDNEVQRTMLELINQRNGFDPRGNIKVLTATDRRDTLDPALLRPGRIDRRIDADGCAHMLRIHARSMSCERDIPFDLIPVASERDFLDVEYIRPH